MSYAATAWAFGQHRLSPEQKLVLIVLSDFHTPEGRCHISERMLAFETGLAPARLGEVLDELDNLNLAIRLPAGGFTLGGGGGGAR